MRKPLIEEHAEMNFAARRLIVHVVNPYTGTLICLKTHSNSFTPFYLTTPGFC